MALNIYYNDGFVIAQRMLITLDVTKRIFFKFILFMDVKCYENGDKLRRWSQRKSNSKPPINYRLAPWPSALDEG